jgi:hypothetical protein
MAVSRLLPQLSAKLSEGKPGFAWAKRLRKSSGEIPPPSVLVPIPRGIFTDWNALRTALK